jgi:hypothetical protein
LFGAAGRLWKPLPILALLSLALGIFWYHYWHGVPDIPVYRGAQQVQKDVNKNAAGTPTDPIELLTFATPDKAGDIYTFYDRKLRADGWLYNTCCKMYSSARSDMIHVGHYWASIDVQPSEGGLTKVSVKITHAELYCDCLLGP